MAEIKPTDPTTPPPPAPPALAIPAAPPPKPAPAPPGPPRKGSLDSEIERELEEAMADLDSALLLTGGRPGRAAARGPQAPEEGKKRGKVVSVHKDDVFVDVGGRSQGVLSASEFPEGPPKVGQEIEVTVEGYDEAEGLLTLSRFGTAAKTVDWSTVARGVVVEARVTGHNKGGLEVDVNGIRGFMPASQIDLFRVENLGPFVNQKLRCVVTEARQSERKLVVSRRELLEKEREAVREKVWETLAEGQVYEGVVRSVKDFGAFLDIGGVDGLLPAGEMAWSRVEDPTKVVQVGQKLKVVLLRLDRDRKKLTLGLKQLLPSPWDDLEGRYPPDGQYPGKVTKLMEFGAFVELEPGVEGLVHISELASRHVRRPQEVVRVGQDVMVRVLKIDKEQKRISLSLKTPQTAPPPAAEPEAEEEPAKKKPPRPRPLRGGL